jgi:hypothetical protein
MSNGLLRAIAEALAADIAAKVPALVQVLPEWPEANQLLNMPAATIETQQPLYERCAPYLLSLGSVANNQATSLYIVGEYTLQMQLDIWTKYKVQRGALYEAVFQALQPSGSGWRGGNAGYTLQLAAYYNEWTNFTLKGYKFMDQGDSIREKTWRAVLQLEASCRAVGTNTDYVITQPPVLTFDTPDNIP